MFLQAYSLNLVPVVLAGVCLSVYLLLYTYRKIRPKFPVRVSCWFCNTSSDVPYNKQNCWDCSHCEQYNGFSADGGYNKVIPAQHDELLNHSLTTKAAIGKKCSSTFSKSPLCRKCLINQDLKVHQLASFTPRNPAFFDEEIEEYRQHLERAYQLCEACESKVKRTLQQQQSWLLDQYHKHQSSHPTQANCKLVTWWQRGFPVVWLQRAQVTSSVTSFIMLVAHCHTMSSSFRQYFSPDIAFALEITPEYEHIAASVVTCALIIITGGCLCRSNQDIICTVMWLIMCVHKWLLFWPYLANQSSEEDLKMGQVVVIGMTLLTNIFTAVSSHQDLPRKLMLRNLKLDDGKVFRGHGIAEHITSLDGSSASEHASSSDKTSLIHSPKIISPLSSTFISSTYSPLQSQTPCTTSAGSCALPEDLECGLGKLSIGSCTARNKNCSVFETRPYGLGNSLSVYQTSHHESEGMVPPNVQYQNNLLRPSKLNVRRKVTQTSWVAGGYWRELGGTLSKAVQSGRNLFENTLQSPNFNPASNFSPVSRTSSQSSGFHSHSSHSPASSPNSYSGSVCGGDVDCFSVLSEPAYPCSSSEQLNMRVMKPPLMGYTCCSTIHMCIPHPCQNFTAPLGMYPSHGVPSMVNHQCFAAPKVYMPLSCCTTYPQHPAKQFPLGPSVPLHASSHCGSSQHSSDHTLANNPVPRKMQNIWLIIRQNVLLSALCIGSLLVNVVGVGALVYLNHSIHL